MCQIVTYRRVLMLLLLLVSVSALVSCTFGKGQMSEEFIIVEVSGAMQVPVSLVQSENNESIKKKDERSFFFFRSRKSFLAGKWRDICFGYKRLL